MGLLECERIEEALKREVTWRVYQEQDEMMRWELIPYNTCVAAHAHRASRGLPPENSLMRFWGTHGGTPEFAAKVGYEHNQAAVVGSLKDDPDVEVANFTSLRRMTTRSIYKRSCSLILRDAQGDRWVLTKSMQVWEMEFLERPSPAFAGSQLSTNETRSARSRGLPVRFPGHDCG